MGKAVNHKNKGNLTEGPISRQLVHLTIPMIIGMLSVIVFTLVDTYFIGQLGTKELAAISFTFPIVGVMFGISFGLGNGAASVISRSIGKGDFDQVRRLTTDALLLGIIVVFIFTVIGILTIDPLFTAMGAPKDLLPLINDYMVLWYLGIVFLVIPVIGNNVLRALGNTLFPSIVMSVAGIVNALLDPVLIFGMFGFPALGIQGAAWASLVSRALTLLASLLFLHFKENLITFHLKDKNELKDSWKAILHVGIPATGVNLVNPLSIAVITALLATYGKEAVAAYGVASRIENFALLIVMALASVIGPFVGQNWGSEKYHRVVKGLDLSYGFAIIWGILTSLILIFFGSFFSQAFTDNLKVIEITSLYFLIVSISYGAYGMIMIASASFNAVGKPGLSVVMNLTRMLLLYVPLALMLKFFLGLEGIFWASTFATLVSGFGFYYWNRYTCQMKECEIKT